MALTTSSMDGARCLLPEAPLQTSKALAHRFACDLAIPSRTGMGNILMYTRLVDDLSRSLGRPLRILTGAQETAAGRLDGDLAHPVWAENPHVAEIVDPSNQIGDEMRLIEGEQDNLCQFGHVIENIAFHYGLKASAIRPSLYLSKQECVAALDRVKDLPRPLICVHPYGTSSPLPGHPWHTRNWLDLIRHLGSFGSMIEVGLAGIEQKNLGLPRFKTYVREMMALVWASDLFVGFDSSVAHIATAFQKPAVVLWEPIRKVEIEERYQRGFAAAAISRWGYPQNRNLVLLGDRDDEIALIVERFVRSQLT